MLTIGQRKEKLRQYKIPQTKDKHVGIELEFSSPTPMDVFQELLIEKDLDQYISMGHDGGEYDGEVGYEFRVLIKQREMETVIQQIVTLIAAQGGRFHPDSGLHVHLDMRHRNADRAFNNLVKSQDILFGIADPLRLDNDYCEKVDRSNLKKYQDEHGGHHYAAINPVLQANKKTIEIRIRESCTDWKDIYFWCRLLCLIADGPEFPLYIESVTQLETTLRLPRYIRDYVSLKIKDQKKRPVYKNNGWGDYDY